MKKPVLGKVIRGGSGGLAVDVTELLVSRLIIQADSGSGKSYTLRKLCEVLYGLALVWVVDPEGEFGTLREAGDYVIVGGSAADVPIPRIEGDGKRTDVQAQFERHVARMVEELIALKANVVFDLFDLPPVMDAKTKGLVTQGKTHDPTRAGFVAALALALVNLPKKFWRPMFVVLDEAQEYAPEGGKDVPSLVPLATFSALARKRGQCPVYATNAIAEFSKGVARGVKNYLIGSAALDADNKRAAKYLGFGSGSDELRNEMDKGEFFAFGPALSRKVVKIKVGVVKTTHPTPGKPAPVVPEPPEKVKKVLAQLRALPTRVAKQDEDFEALKQRIAALKVELKKKDEELEMARKKIVSKIVETEVPVLDKASVRNLEQGIKRVEKLLEVEAKILDRKAQAQQAITSELGNLKSMLATALGHVDGDGRLAVPVSASAAPHDVWKSVAAGRVEQPVRKGQGIRALIPAPPKTVSPASSGLERREERVLSIITFYAGEGISTAQCAALSGYSPDSESFLKILRKLRDEARINWDRGRVNTSGVGGAQALDAASHIDHWKQCPKFDPRHLRVLDVLVVEAPSDGSPIKTADLAAKSNYSPDSESFLKIVRFFRDLDLIVWERGESYCTDFLMRRNVRAVAAGRA